MNLSKKVLHTIVKDKLVNPYDTLVVGVSGGADSVALLHVLYQLRHHLGIKLCVAHLNHRLRPNAEKDEAFVRNLAKQMNLPITILRRMKPSQSTIVSEDKARGWRFDFFKKVAHKYKAQAIVLAHTQNDLAETVLMRLLRGVGLLGLRGILVENQMKGTRVIRPFLTIQRKQVEEYLKINSLKFCTDETNKQTYYLRNKVRLKLLPTLIKEYNHNLSNVLVDLALTSAEDYNYILNEATEFFKKNANVSKERISVKSKVFLKAPMTIRRMFLRLAFEHLVFDFLQLSFSHIQEVEDMLLRRPQGSVVHWPKSVQVTFKENLLILGLRN